ncbi:MAG: M48 family metallopeptidase [Symploca sp. SIO3E6]|nr:M48 family metallopeptidase [Caldora sp. SIO3E6]
MAIQYLERNYLGFQEYIYRTDRKAWGTSLYAHPVEKWIVVALSPLRVKAVINEAIETFVRVQFRPNLTSSVVIDWNTFPDHFETLNHCTKTLGIPFPLAVVQQDNDANIAYSAGIDEYAFISISSDLYERFSEQEARFIIGRECGHIANGNMFYHTLATVLIEEYLGKFDPLIELLGRIAGAPLMAWSRRSEVTADRAGLLCCQDIDSARRALLKVEKGLSELDWVDIKGYLENSEEIITDDHTAQLRDSLESKPQFLKRIKALELFSESELYYILSGQTKPIGKTLLRQEELNRLVNKLVQL